MMPAATISDLPEALLLGVLAHLPRAAGHVVTLVCKQWRRLFFQAPELWRSLVIWESASWTCTAPYERLSSDTAAAAAAWFRAKLALVRRVGPLAAQAQLGENNFDELGRHAGEERALVQLLSAFSPAALTRLELEQCTELEPAVAASLGALTALHTLRCASFSLLDPKLLPGLPRLVELSLEASVLPAWDAATLHRLARLTSLRLLGGQMEPASLHPLTVLSNLRELEVTRLAPWRDDAGIVEGSLAAPPASAFPYLQRLTLHSDWLTLAPDVRLHSIAARSVEATPMIQLRRSPDDSSRWLVMLANVVLQRSCSIAGILRGLHVRPSAVARLHLRGCVVVEPAAVAEPLPGATRLILAGVEYVGYMPFPPLQPQLFERWLPPLLAHMPALEVVNLLSVPPQTQDVLAAAAAHLAALPRLCILQCSGCDVAELPEDLHLDGLRTLALNGNALAALPPALAAAARLEELLLQGNPGLELQPADVDGVLARMPALRVLQLSGGQLPAATAALLAQHLPQLEVRLDADAEPAAEN